MGKNSHIAWTDSTWNPWVGCKKISAACRNCYMFKDQQRFGRNPEDIVRTTRSTFSAPVTWREPALVFTCSWSDFFIEEADGMRADAWKVISQTQHLTYLILTKRPERIADNLPENWGKGYPNVWLGVSVESEDYAFRLEKLLKIPTVLRFVSFEPALGPVDFTPYLHKRELNWIIAGGESGPHARPVDTEWFRQARIDAKVFGTPFFMKQMGTVWARSYGDKMDKKGENQDSWDQMLRIQEFPKRHIGYKWIPGRKEDAIEGVKIIKSGG